MIVRLLGVADFLAGVLLFLLKFDIGATPALFFGLYLLVKGVVFLADAVSFMDILAGVALLLASYGFYPPFTWVFVLWLLQKGIFSFFSAG